MKYDFHSIPDRSNSGSAKWRPVPGASPELVPLSVADMEFPTAPAIVDALKNLLDTEILGYTKATPAYFEAVCGWMERHHQFRVDPEQIVLTPGVVQGLGCLIDTVTKPNEQVVIMNPVYYPFDRVILEHDRQIAYCPLKLEGIDYSIDFELFERLAAQKEVTALLFCNPHNPIGRVWTRAELERLVEICHKNGLFIISDEIHNDLIMPGYTHTVTATVSQIASEICAVCTAPSKTFNLAGVQCSNIIVPHQYAEAVRARAKQLYGMLNIFAYTACTTAYNQCEDWMEELLQVVYENGLYVQNFIKEHIPEITVIPPQGTYLQWWDCRGLRLSTQEQEQFMHDAGLWLDEGYIFGRGGEGFARINLACSRITLERTMQRLLDAVIKLRNR